MPLNAVALACPVVVVVDAGGSTVVVVAGAGAAGVCVRGVVEWEGLPFEMVVVTFELVESR